MKKLFFCFSLAIFAAFFGFEKANAQPAPGDYFKEYSWTTSDKDGNIRFLRVGGRFDYILQPENYPDSKLEGEKIFIEEEIDLTNAVKAEIIAEKVLCHDGTKNLRISFNGGKQYSFPESRNIPEPQEYYMHHFYPVVSVPVSEFKNGSGNYFSMEVDTAHHWNWPQNLIYGVIFRIYYKQPETPDLQINALQVNEKEIICSVSGSDKNKIESVDYIAKYDGPDWDGDGVYNDWHYHYFRGELLNHVGTSNKQPYEKKWDIGWIPDQQDPVLVSARINLKSGYTFFAEATKINIERKSYAVEICKPKNVPKQWLTRNGEHEEEVFIHSELKNITRAKMVFTTWSSGYFNGIYINDNLVFMREGNRYDFKQHHIQVDYLEALEQGKNRIKTGKTQLHHGQMVHGVEVMWPGIMLLVKTEKQEN